MKSNISKRQAIDELWRRGELVWKCHPVQKEMHSLFHGAEKNSISVWLLGRQSGKSTLLTILALEQAIKKPNSVIKLITDTKVHLKSIFEPIFRDILLDCPDDVKPKYHSAQFCFHFANGSQIQLAGTDNKHYEKLRGQKSDLVLIDEAGFCADLEDIITSVLLPTTVHTGGKIILASTPPKEENHPFLKFLEDAELNNRYIKKTVDDNPLLSKEQVQKIADGIPGGRASEQFRREFLCEIIKSEERSVIPEFTDALQNEIVKSWPRPPYYDAYEGMDLGFNDLTGIVFGYYDFRADRIIIEDEMVVEGKNLHLPKLTEDIEKKDRELWSNPLTNEMVPIYKRVSDINPIVTNEISRFSNGQINFLPSKKDNKDAAINTLRVLLANKKIIINPKCQHLIRHLRNVKWKSSSDKTTFARSPDEGHYDLVDALIYLVRNIDFKHNPYPNYYDLQLRKADAFFPNGSQSNNSQIGVFKKVFNKR